jgi:indolepyruvate decarboxylase
MSRLSIGAYLLARLSECGIDTLFGVPGDFNLALLEQVEAAPNLQWVGNCNELNAAYAADGYARIKGASGLIVTYGVGDLSALNGIAGSYAEHVPVICISGIPPMRALRQHSMLHHTSGSGNFEDVISCLAQFTAAQTRLTPTNAASEIDRVVTTAMREKLPVYMQIPSDITDIEINAPMHPLNWTTAGDSIRTDCVIAQIAKRIDDAKRPALLVDADAQRFGLGALIRELGELAGIPFATMSSGRSILDEQHPLFRGIYVGSVSAPATVTAIEQSDCLIAIGVRFFDSTTSVFSHTLEEERMVIVEPFSVSLDAQTIEGVNAKEILEGLVKLYSERREQHPWPRQNCTEQASCQAGMQGIDAPLSHATLWPVIADFLAQGDLMLVENGTAQPGIASIRLPGETHFISQSVWASIGYTLPALLGCMLARAEGRHLLFIGDGSLQMTVQEISTLLSRKLKPIIFVLNNHGYTIERVILGAASSYNDIASWNYTALPGAFNSGSKVYTWSVRTVAELQQALAASADPQGLTLIELHLGSTDAPNSLKNMGKRVAEYNFDARVLAAAAPATSCKKVL